MGCWTPCLHIRSELWHASVRMQMSRRSLASGEIMGEIMAMLDAPGAHSLLGFVRLELQLRVRRAAALCIVTLVCTWLEGRCDHKTRRDSLFRWAKGSSP